MTRIGTMTAEEAIAAVRPVAYADNEMQRIDVTASYLREFLVVAERQRP